MSEPRTQTITIANGAQDSGVVLLEDNATRQSFDCMLFAPLTMAETVTVQVADTTSGQVWRALQSAGVDVTLTAGKATALVGLVAASLRLRAGTTVAAQRDFGWRARAR